MPQYYVYPTQAQAQAKSDRIFARLKSACVMQGYAVDKTTGGIVGKTSTGVDIPGALTLGWDTPRQRADGKWIVAHAATVPGQSFVLDASQMPPLTLAAALAADDLSASVSVQNSDASWWPLPPTMKVST